MHKRRPENPARGAGKISPVTIQAALKNYFDGLPSPFRRSMFIVFFAGFVADALFSLVCMKGGFSLFVTHAAGFGGSLSVMLLVVRRLRINNDRQPAGLLDLRLGLSLVLIWLIRIGIFSFLETSTPLSSWPFLPMLASVLASVAAISYIAVIKADSNLSIAAPDYRLTLLAVITISLISRFLFAGSFELLKEEAYYWAYAQHFDIGYLDHPPMVAVLIKLFTLLLGDSELAVRFGAMFCWVIAVVYAYRYCADVCDQETALQSAFIMAVVPGFFMFGLFMTPDAPLIACWSGSLFYLRRALVDLDRRSWIGAGIFLGLGLTSKYSIALLGPAVLAFLVIDRQARHLLIRPFPYGAALLALLVFSPVIVWNMQHEWASFLFQTQNRLEASSEFSSHELLLFILILLSPVGFTAALFFFISRRKFIENGTIDNRNYRFAAIMTLVPLLIFFYFSLSKEIKFNWTCPLWLAALPFMAMTLSRGKSFLSARAQYRFLTSWRVTAVVLFLGYAGLFQLFAVSIPGIPYRGGGPLWGWESYARQLDRLVVSIEEKTGRRPVVIGMDQYKTASGLAFYRTISQDQAPGSDAVSPLAETLSRNIATERSAVMFEYWSSPSQYDGWPMILVSPSRAKLNELWITRNIENFTDIYRIETNRYGEPASPLFYRLANLAIEDLTDISLLTHQTDSAPHQNSGS